jgi:hypothetical protein
MISIISKLGKHIKEHTILGLNRSTSIITVAQTLVDGANIDWNMANGEQATITLGGNRTMNAPTNLVAGKTYTLFIYQDNSAPRTLIWNAVFKWSGGTAPVLSSGNAELDIIEFKCDGTSLYGVRNPNFS